MSCIANDRAGPKLAVQAIQAPKWTRTSLPGFNLQAYICSLYICCVQVFYVGKIAKDLDLAIGRTEPPTGPSVVVRPARPSLLPAGKASARTQILQAGAWICRLVALQNSGQSFPPSATPRCASFVLGVSHQQERKKNRLTTRTGVAQSYRCDSWPPPSVRILNKDQIQTLTP